jgi:hypothetical protein
LPGDLVSEKSLQYPNSELVAGGQYLSPAQVRQALRWWSRGQHKLTVCVDLDYGRFDVSEPPQSFQAHGAAVAKDDQSLQTAGCLAQSSGQVAQIRDFIANPGARGTISISITAYFDSKVGILEVKQRIERRNL